MFTFGKCLQNYVIDKTELDPHLRFSVFWVK